MKECSVKLEVVDGDIPEDGHSATGAVQKGQFYVIQKGSYKHPIRSIGITDKIIIAAYAKHFPFIEKSVVVVPVAANPGVNCHYYLNWEGFHKAWTVLTSLD